MLLKSTVTVDNLDIYFLCNQNNISLLRHNDSYTLQMLSNNSPPNHSNSVTDFLKVHKRMLGLISINRWHRRICMLLVPVLAIAFALQTLPNYAKHHIKNEKLSVSFAVTIKKHESIEILSF